MIFHVSVVKVTGNGSNLPEGCADMICRSIFKEVQVQTLSQTDRCAVYNIYSTLLSHKLPGKIQIQKMFPQILVLFQNCLQDSLFLKYWVVLKIKTDLQKMGIDFAFLLQNYRRWAMILCLALFSPWIQRKTLAISYWHSTVLEPSFWISL